jgi:hypothetical protein
MSWSKLSGFRFSSSKTNLLIFNQKRKSQKISINIRDRTKPRVKVLGITFDSKASWIPHIQNLKNSITSRLNIIKILAHTSWGAQSSTFLKIHKAFIFSKMDYGAPLFSTAKVSHLNSLETIHNTGIRLSIGAFRSSPIPSIHAIAGIPSQAKRWEEQTSKIAAKAAKQAHTNTNIPYSYLFSYSDIKKVIEMDTCQQWETQWNNMTTKLN